MTTLAEAIGRDVSRETLSKLDDFVQILVAENKLQNLISAKSELEMWERHILDSAQLLRFAPEGSTWSDVGSGAGLPGLVLAIVDSGRKVLIEPRRGRVEFLQQAIDGLGLTNASIVAGKASAAVERTTVITARAVASPSALFKMTSHFRNDWTTYVLPRGRNAQSELVEAQNTWQGDFGLHPSLTSDEASILVARNVRRRGSR